MQRGRPARSEIRDNILNILQYLGEGYGYEIAKLYMEIFPKVTLRSIYYHLRKGVELGEIIVKRVQQEKGNYSWGNEAQKVYYALSPNASPGGDESIRKAIDEFIKTKTEEKIKIQ